MLLIRIGLLSGAPMYGHLEQSGIGTSLEWESIPTAQDLIDNCEESNKELLATIKDDVYEEGLFKLTMQDVEANRMKEPVSGALS